MTKKPAPKKSIETKEYILDLANGNTRKIIVPASWKLTFGSLIPYVKGQASGPYSGAAALRFYEGTRQDGLRSVMTDVVSFRDASMGIVEKRTSVQRKTMQKASAKGAKDVIVEARVTEWVNPDAVEDDSSPNEFLQLTEGAEF